MKDSASYLIKLLDCETAAWSEDLRRVLLATEPTEISETPQHCVVYFALSQARRRLETSRAQGKTTFGIESLIATLSALNEDETLDYYVISNSTHLGTCYVLQNRLLGCEFVLKSGTQSKRGLWIDGKPIA